MTTKNKILKSAFQVDNAINSIPRNINYARNRAVSVQYWLHKNGSFAVIKGRVI